MDFDLFSSDDLGDELVSSAHWEPTQGPIYSDTVNREPIFAELHCQGEDTAQSRFAEESFLRKGWITDLELHRTFDNYSWQDMIPISDMYDFKASDLNVTSVVEYCLTEACINVQCLFANVKKGQMTYGHNTATATTTISNFQRRHQVTTLCQVLLYSVEESLWPIRIAPRLEPIRQLWQGLSRSNSQYWQSIYMANSPKGNDSQLAAYHLLHGLLEWKFIDLCLQCKLVELKITTNIAHNGSSTEEHRANSVTQQIQSFCDELTVCSLLLFARKRSCLDLLNTSCFPCTCFKETWLLILNLLRKREMGKEEPQSIWYFFNGSINSLKTQLVHYSLTNTNYCLFVNWLLVGLVRLNGYRSNGEFEGTTYACRNPLVMENLSFLEKNTQEFLQSQPSEDQLRVYISLLRPLIAEDWWPAKINIPIQLWEYFHKRLNNVFYIAGSAPSQLAITSTSGQGYLERYRQLQDKKNWDGNLCSYTMFVLLMGSCLRRLRQDSPQQPQQHQTQKLLGRIYSKFSAQKLLSLNEIGIHHLIELFLILALNGDLRELMPKLRDQLLTISLDKVNASKQVAVTRGHMALWLLCVEERHDLRAYIERFLKQIEALVNESPQHASDLPSPVKLLAECLFDVIKGADDFQRGEELLIDSWLTKYMTTCTNPNEMDRILEGLHLIFVKLHSRINFIENSPRACIPGSASSSVLKSLHMHILPFVKQQFVSSYSHWLPKLAADFCLSMDNLQNFQQLFSYFTDVHQTRNHLASTQFLLRILQSDQHVSLIEPGVIIQVWLKSLVFQNPTRSSLQQQQQPSFDDDVKQLSAYVSQLPEFQEITGTQTGEGECIIVNSKEPLCSFVAAVGQTFSAIPLDEVQRRTQFSLRFNGYLKNFDKWLPPFTNSSDGWKGVSERPELVNRFYSFLAIVIYHCAPLVYTPAKVTCFLNIVLTRYILPTFVQMGKVPDQRMSQCVHKIWPVLVQGIGRLNYHSDAYINKALTDIIQKWTPHLKISSNAKIVAKPFIKCLITNGPSNKELSLFILDKLTTLFLTIQRRQPETHASLVVAIFQELLEALSQEESLSQVEGLYLTFIQATSVLMMEHIMLVDEFVPSRQQLLELLRRLLTSEHYKLSPVLRSEFVQQVEVLIRKHLAYYTFFFFELMYKLASISAQTIAVIMDTLLAEILVVEEKRGAGQDAKIRACYHKLQQLINVKIVGK